MARASVVDATLLAQLERVEMLVRRARLRLAQLPQGSELPADAGAAAEVWAPLLDLASELPDLGWALSNLLLTMQRTQPPAAAPTR